MSKENVDIRDRESRRISPRVMVIVFVCVAAIAIIAMVGRFGLIGSDIALAQADETSSSSSSASSTVGTCGSETTISVTGSDSVTVVPDKADARVSVLAESSTADDATSQATTTASAVKDAMIAAGLTEDMIQTSGVTVSPVYSWDENGKRSLDAYDASVYFDLSGMDISAVGDVLSGALDAGANAIDTLTYYTSQYDDLYNQALVKAVTQAQTKADTLAKAANMGSIAIKSIYETPDTQAYRYIDTSNMTLSAADTSTTASKSIDSGSISAGTIEIEAQVNMTYVAR